MRKKITLYSAHMKLADIISHDHELLPIIERLNIKLGFGDSDIAQVCKRYDLSVDLFLMICNVYSFENYTPNTSTLKITDIPHIVSYLRASHHYYIKNFFPSLHKNIHKMVQSCDEASQIALNRFYDNYDAEAANHFEYEENVVFPYIENLIQKNTSQKNEYSIEQFERNHTNIEEKLNDLKSIVIKYIPEENSNAARFEVVNNIFQIERDLMKHTLVENKLLIPLVSKLEQNE